MNSNIERTIAQTERWLIALDEQRDLAARHRATFGPSPELDSWMAAMEKERTDVLAILERLKAERHNACLILQDRPERSLRRQLKVPLHRPLQRKEA